MSAKEAINILAKMQNYDSKRNVEALEIAISALEKVPLLEAENAMLREKETPKEPKDGKCPNCDKKLVLTTNAGWYQVSTPYPKFCPNCGQAVKKGDVLC